MTALAVIPEPHSVDLERAHDLAQQITEWAGTTESIPELEDARARVAAIETYLRKRDAQAAAALAAADRRLEVRIGELLGPAQRGAPPNVRRDEHSDGLSPQNRHAFRKMAEHKDEPAVAEAIENGASRNEVLRRIGVDRPTTAQRIEEAKRKHPLPQSVNARVAKARKMAATGYTSRQIAAELGIKGMSAFRTRHGIEVPADEVVGRPRAVDAQRVVTEAAHTLEGLAMGLDLVTPDDIDADTLPELCASMQDSLRRILAFHKRMKERRDA